MRYLNKIIFIQSAHVPYAEVKLDGNVHFIGTQGVGKSTILRALLFFYNADKLHLGIPKEKKTFDSFYFPYSNSYIIYEVMKEEGAYCVVALKAQGRAMYRFVDAPYDARWFIDEDKNVRQEWSQVREQIGKEHEISTLVSSYDTYRDIIFGNNRRQELMPFRKYAIVESTKYQNIPRTIQNVFLNTKLDADFIKNTIIRSMSDEDMSINLNFYREQIKQFEQEYRDVKCWTKKNKAGEVAVRKYADNAIDAYRSLNYNRQQILRGRQELNYAMKMAELLLPQSRADIAESERDCDRLSRLFGEERTQYDKQCEGHRTEMGILERDLKVAADKHRHYDEMGIDDILRRVELEPAVAEEKKRQEGIKDELQKSCQDIEGKYAVLFDKLDIEMRSFVTAKNALLTERKSKAMGEKEQLMQNLRQAESDARRLNAGKLRVQEDAWEQLLKQETDLKISKARVDHENPYAKEIADKEREKADLDARREQHQADLKAKEERIAQMRKESEDALKIKQLEFEQKCAEPKKHKQEIDDEIQRLNALMEKSKGSFSEWLDKNVKGWQDNIGKVVNEETILYSDQLNPQMSMQLMADKSLYGVSIDLDAIERKFRTPKELKKQIGVLERQRAECAKQLAEWQQAYDDDVAEFTRKCNLSIRQVKDEIFVMETELAQMPDKLKDLEVQLMMTRGKLTEWRKKQLEQIERQLGELASKKCQKDKDRLSLDEELQQALKHLQEEHLAQVKAVDEASAKYEAETNADIQEKQRQTEARKAELTQAQNKELRGAGMDVAVLEECKGKIAQLEAELGFIRDHRNAVFAYQKDKEELFDKEPQMRQKCEAEKETLKMLKDQYKQRTDSLASQLKAAQGKLAKQKAALKEQENGMGEAKRFCEDRMLCPPGAMDVGEKATTQGCHDLVEALKGQIYNDVQSLNTFKKFAQQFLGCFSVHNIFHFKVNPVSDEDFFEFAANLSDFMENDKIAEYQKQIGVRYIDIIRRISKEVGDLTRREGGVRKTIGDINRDFKVRNFAGVIKEIALRELPTDDTLVQLLLQIKKFTDDNQDNMGENNLFATESREEINAKSVGYLFDLMKGLEAEPNRKQVLVEDTFKLEFRIKENDNDTGWIEKIANVGSEGTDILVKAMINIMLINVFKEKASKKFGDFKLHCMMDEIGKLHPNNVKGILDFANCRNILLVNCSPTTYNVESYKYTYLLTKDGKSNTKVVQLIKRL